MLDEGPDRVQGMLLFSQHVASVRSGFVGDFSFASSRVLALVLAGFVLRVSFASGGVCFLKWTSFDDVLNISSTKTECQISSKHCSHCTSLHYLSTK